MTFFYLSAVKGNMPVHLLETIVCKRLEYLNIVFKGDAAVYNEYVIEGSLYDNVGHFTLCVLAILGDNVNFKQFFLKAEIDLFKNRLATLSTYDMRSVAKKLLRSIKKCENIPYFVDSLQVLCQHLMLKEVAQHVCSSSHNVNCSVHSIRVNFKQCLEYVARRQVELSHGVAVIPCGKWKQYLVQLFSTNLKYRIYKTDIKPLKSDPRVIELLVKFQAEVFPFIEDTCSAHILRSKEVDNASKYFPPCMLNLHRCLREKHRLSHMQRFHYSLFLKDIGMPVGEAVDFWRAEYRQSPAGHHSCCHSWEKDEKKYLYGIRHMYGLEGGRKSYTSVNCKRIQSSESSCSEGGCPFMFDDSKMMELLSCSNIVMSQIYELKKRQQYTSACVMYLQSINKNNCDNLSFNFTPVRFFNVASKINNI